MRIFAELFVVFVAAGDSLSDVIVPYTLSPILETSPFSRLLARVAYYV